MYKAAVVDQSVWNQYLETPRQRSSPTRIDAILEERLKAFIKARHIKRFTFVR